MRENEREGGKDQYRNRETEGDRKRGSERERMREGGKDQYRNRETEGDRKRGRENEREGGRERPIQKQRDRGR